VWPTVRDDDWCGEWKTAPARMVPRHPEPHPVVSAVREQTNGNPRAIPQPAADAVIAVGAAASTRAPAPLAAVVAGAD
jgi:hypothetical protein